MARWVRGFGGWGVLKQVIILIVDLVHSCWEISSY